MSNSFNDVEPINFIETRIYKGREDGRSVFIVIEVEDNGVECVVDSFDTYREAVISAMECGLPIEDFTRPKSVPSADR